MSSTSSFHVPSPNVPMSLHVSTPNVSTYLVVWDRVSRSELKRLERRLDVRFDDDGADDVIFMKPATNGKNVWFFKTNNSRYNEALDAGASLMGL